MIRPTKPAADPPGVATSLSAEDIAERKAFLEFGESDVALLREIHDHVLALGMDDVFADLFYFHLRAFPELRKFLRDDATVERLKVILAQYFHRLTEGNYDASYVGDRLRVGYMHQRVGLGPKWYTGAYRKYLSFLLSAVCELHGVADKRFVDTFDALLKVVFFDMELALDTYFQGDRRELLHLANHDALTGLPNRNLLADRIEQAIHQAHRDGGHAAILFIDLDRFKYINDSLGHPVGDKVIAAVAARLAAAVREGDTVARLGGDEFAVVLSGIRHDDSIALIAEKLLAGVEPPIHVDRHELFVSGSIGIAVYPMDGETQEELLKNADTAMYRAKLEGNTFRFYQREMNQMAAVRLGMESRLRKAVERGEFLLHYQPQIDVATGRLAGVEALLRWKAGNTVIAPDEFIPLAEETGLIISIGEWALRHAAEQAVAWHRMTPRAPHIAVNFSARQLWRSDIVACVAGVLSAAGCEPHWIELEITESVMMTRPEEAASKLAALAEMGIRISIDDFGTGYSSLAYLKQLPIHALKIDRSFIRDITSDPDDASIVRAIVALAHSLDLKVVAEGVEDDAQLSFIASLDCDAAQGYMFSEPLPADRMTRILQEVTFDALPGRWQRRSRRYSKGNAAEPIVVINGCNVKNLGNGIILCQEESRQCEFSMPFGKYCRNPEMPG
ncbi:MAG TPA: EAL domain-containing protein [Gallionellaceae bacterium]|nr:EAL domain-containing protein [Gallionellaceae bacterium]